MGCNNLIFTIHGKNFFHNCATWGLAAIGRAVGLCVLKNKNIKKYLSIYIYNKFLLDGIF
jgi:hypothetical protein